jgi:hypothetical protein
LVAGGINRHRKHVSGKKNRTEQIFEMIVAPERGGLRHCREER